MQFSDIIARCGGLHGIASAVDLGESAVRKWAINGVPDRYWAALFKLDRALTPTALFNLNQEIRKAQNAKR